MIKNDPGANIPSDDSNDSIPRPRSNSSRDIQDDILQIETEDLIKFVKEQTVLWDFRHSDYFVKTRKDDAWNEILKALFPDWNESSKESKQARCIEVQKRWRNIRDAYKKDKKIQEQEGTGRTKRRYVFSSHLAFLDECNESKRNHSSGQSTSKQDTMEVKEEEKDDDVLITETNLPRSSLNYPVTEKDEKPKIVADVCSSCKLSRSQSIEVDATETQNVKDEQMDVLIVNDSLQSSQLTQDDSRNGSCCRCCKRNNTDNSSNHRNKKQRTEVSKIKSEPVIRLDYDAVPSTSNTATRSDRTNRFDCTINDPDMDASFLLSFVNTMKKLPLSLKAELRAELSMLFLRYTQYYTTNLTSNYSSQFYSQYNNYDFSNTAQDTYLDHQRNNQEITDQTNESQSCNVHNISHQLRRALNLRGVQIQSHAGQNGCVVFRDQEYVGQNQTTAVLQNQRQNSDQGNESNRLGRNLQFNQQNPDEEPVQQPPRPPAPPPANQQRPDEEDAAVQNQPPRPPAPLPNQQSSHQNSRSQRIRPNRFLVQPVHAQPSREWLTRRRSSQPTTSNHNMAYFAVPSRLQMSVDQLGRPTRFFVPSSYYQYRNLDAHTQPSQSNIPFAPSPPPNPEELALQEQAYDLAVQNTQ